MILNASAAKGSSSEECLSTSLPSRSTPLIAGMSRGEGMNSTTASIIFWIPLFLYADPHTTGTALHSQVALRSAAFISSAEGSSPSRYIIIRSSSRSQIFSIISARYSSASSANCSGISPIVMLSPLSSLYVYASISNRSMIPVKVSSAPMGIWIMMAFLPSLLRICSTEP